MTMSSHGLDKPENKWIGNVSIMLRQKRLQGTTINYPMSVDGKR